ncbi:hypothetical protein B296_00049430 [Ensete ventricosum]|uniref:Uncharacterized protein n=1 Tax=Ensete ventricosum TaxID=4639 RepID=A0A426YQN4_ENSVE|nr:hypothetical protein B296_00049430 [Ensete ventricosum]
MGETEYLSSLIYLTKELYASSKTLRRNLMEDSSCQSSPLVINATKSRLSALFSNRISIESGSDANLLGSDN